MQKRNDKTVSTQKDALAASLSEKTATGLLSGIVLLLTTTETAFTALAAAIVLLISTVICGVLASMLGKRVPAFALIALSAVTVSGLQLVFGTRIPALPINTLPIALIGASLFVFLQAREAAGLSAARAITRSLISGASFAAVLLVTGCVREVLGKSSLFGTALFGGRFDAPAVFSEPAGAFFLASAACACMLAISRRVNHD